MQENPAEIYVGEARVSELTNISRAWFTRARTAGIGPKYHKVGKRVIYRLADVLAWIESGESATEGLTSRPAGAK